MARHQSQGLAVSDKPIDQFTHHLEKRYGKLNYLCSKKLGITSIGNLQQIHSKEISRQKKPCLTYKFWRSGQEANAYVVKFDPKHKDGWNDIHEEHRIHGIVDRDASRHIPVAEPIHVSTDRDEGIVGTKFAITKFVKGSSYEDISEVPKEFRRQVLESSARVLASIHGYHWVRRYGGGLELECDFKHRRDFWADDTQTWNGNLSEAAKEKYPKTAKFFRDMVEGDKPNVGSTTLVHGDFTLSNLIFEHTPIQPPLTPSRSSSLHPQVQTKVVAVLDWKSSSNGSPMSDLAYLCMMFLQPPAGAQGALSDSKLLVGPPDCWTPSEEDILKVYKTASSPVHTFSQKEFSFAKAASCMRWITIIQGAENDWTESGRTKNDRTENDRTGFEKHQTGHYPSIRDDASKVVDLLTTAGEAFRRDYTGEPATTTSICMPKAVTDVGRSSSFSSSRRASPHPGTRR